MKTLQKLAMAQRRHYYTLSSLAVIVSLLIVLQAYLIVSIVDGLFLDKQTFDQVVYLLLVLLVVLLLRSSASYWTNLIGGKMAANVKMDYRKKLLDSYKNTTLTASYQGQSGGKVSVMLEAVDELDPFYSKYIPQRLMSTIVPVVILIVIFSQHWYSGVIILLTAPFIPIFMMIIGAKTQKKSEEKLESLSLFSGRFLDTLQGLVTLKLYGRSAHYKAVIQKSSLDFRDTTMNILKIAFTSSLMLELISMLSIGLVALELGLRLVVFKEISFFTAFFILLLVPEFYQSLKDLGSAFHAGRSSTGAVEKIEQELLKKEKEIKWGTAPFPKKITLIELVNVQYQYEKQGFRLENINALIREGEQVAIVGKSGSGKSTLLNVLAGLLQPDDGSLLVNKSERSTFKEQAWFKEISYITQHPYLFSGTISENIALGLNASQQEIKEAAKKAGISSLIELMPAGYDTEIGEGGRGLSGGEKQRIALARAFLRKPKIVLFDEPTTGLDLRTEQLLQQSMREMAKECTVITVAHRLQTIKQASTIWFLEKGRLLGQGTHEQLRTNNSAYRQLFDRQDEEEGM
ncbi:thiol reductant ABC exporter subunit CydD [Halalkalibacter akibai]|uniref:Transport ATP-binding protein CydD n=1 Tax=Halalkalibacter akibai (strain ATCC 43226 / DSM 21942 / CIP 109018 / JCM 9157 / 1139) TaxID=1236973 RepID=W4QY99_HALA3|nr:thiol reductant ABC exporter subunit CydD [Halalkalibacter akibai]GAE37110.1 transport ATP-binding protein CydD [Halalkalibacter akibai JCM 9157]